MRETQKSADQAKISIKEHRAACELVAGADGSKSREPENIPVSTRCLVSWQSNAAPNTNIVNQKTKKCVSAVRGESVSISCRLNN